MNEVRDFSCDLVDRIFVRTTARFAAGGHFIAILAE